MFDWFRENLKTGGHAVIWEAAWPESRSVLRQPGRCAMAFQNLGEHVQGNHFVFRWSGGCGCGSKT
jgi:hypothetical protein